MDPNALNETASKDVASIGESGYERIRHDIIFGLLEPDRKLKLDRLKSKYHVSISTLREILSRLAAEGFVVAEGQRGFNVTPVSASDLREIAELRLLLEGFAIEQSFASGDLEWEGRVVAAHHKLSTMEARMKSGDDGAEADSDLWKRFDWEFHQALISACGSKILMQEHGSIFDKYQRYQVLTLGFRGQISCDEHRELLDCALERNAARAIEVLKQHVEGGVEDALSSGLLN